jgi:hypothetical protein
MAYDQELKVKFTGDASNLQRTTKKAESSISGFNETIGKVGTAIAGAFAVREIVRFGAEAVKLAAKMEGVERAFSSISGTSLPELQKATRGTVDNMRLMQAAVQARNFKIPLDQLSGLFAFATKRATETGQSVDYLVSSLVEGLGKKSTMILDNLGISAVSLREKLKGVGLESATTTDLTIALNEVILEQQTAFGDTGLEALTTGQSLEKLTSSFKNYQTELGRSISETEVFKTLLGNVINTIDRSGKQMSAKRQLIDLGMSNDDLDKLIKSLPYKGAFELEALEAKLKEVNSLIDKQVNTVLTEHAGKENQILEAYKQNIYYAEIRKRVLQKLNEQQQAAALASEKVGVRGENEQKVLDKLAQQLTINASAYGINTSQIGLLEGNVSALETALIALRSLGVSPLNEEYKALNATLETSKSLLSSQNVAPLNPTLNAPQKLGTGLPTKPENLEGVKTFNGELEKTDNILKEIGFTWENVGLQFTQGFTSILESGSFTFKSLIVDLTRMIGKMIAALAIQTALRVAMGDLTAAAKLAKILPLVGMAAGGLALGSIPQLAEGGIATSPTLAMIGEGRESEAVLPLSKLDNMMNNGGGGGYIADVRLSGQDFLIGLRRAEQFRGRTSS